MKPDPSRLELENYPFRVEIPVRYGDLDPLRHVNNVSFSRLFEEGRVRFNMMAHEHTDIGSLQGELGMVLVANQFNYLREAFFPDPVTVGVGVARIGNSSFTLACGMFQRGHCVATNDAVLARARAGKGMPLPDALRERIGKWMIGGPAR